jgi:hypothetical protein
MLNQFVFKYSRFFYSMATLLDIPGTLSRLGSTVFLFDFLDGLNNRTSR